MEFLLLGPSYQEIHQTIRMQQFEAIERMAGKVRAPSRAEAKAADDDEGAAPVAETKGEVAVVPLSEVEVDDIGRCCPPWCSLFNPFAYDCAFWDPRGRRVAFLYRVDYKSTSESSGDDG